MALKAVVEKLEDLDEALRTEYKETIDPTTKAKIYVLDIEGAQALPDIVRLTTSLTKERNEHKATKTKFAPFSALGDPTEVQAKLDRIPELEAAAEGKLDDTKINGIVETRIKAKLAPIERERDQLRVQVGERDNTIKEYTAKEKTRMVSGAVGKAAREAKVVDSAVEDIELLGDRVFEVLEDGNVVTKDGVGVTPGLSPKAWLEDMQSKRPHWWGTSMGGGAAGNRNGANGGSGPNPFSAEHWNMTEQGNMVRADRAKAERMAKQAGTTIGGGKPAPKKQAA